MVRSLGCLWSSCCCRVVVIVAVEFLLLLFLFLLLLLRLLLLLPSLMMLMWLMLWSAGGAERGSANCKILRTNRPPCQSILRLPIPPRFMFHFWSAGSAQYSPIATTTEAHRPSTASTGFR